jgi:hypothetical protein
MKTVSLFASVLLILAIFNLPIGYYTFMRIGVTVASAYLITQKLKKGVNLEIIILGLISILFNPIWPIYLGSKSTWKPIDIISSLIFLIIAFNKNQTK